MRRWLLPRMTLLLILSGAIFPYLTGRLQDYYTDSWSERRDFGSVQLSLRQELEAGQVLGLLSGEYAWLEWQGDTRLTEEEAAGALEKVMQELLNREILRPSAAGELDIWINCSIAPHLVVSEDKRDLSAVVWSCQWDMALVEDGNIYDANISIDEMTMGSAMLDDATGQVVYFSIPTSNLWRKETTKWRLQQSISFLEDYYSMEIREVETLSHEEEFCIYLLRFDMGELGLCEVQLSFDNWNVYFNI